VLARRQGVKSREVGGVVEEPAVVRDELADAIEVCSNRVEDRGRNEGGVGTGRGKSVGKIDAPVIARP